MAGEATNPLLQLETRRRIYRRIQEAPGLHFRQLQRDLEMPVGTLEYNLHQMERDGLVVAREDAGLKSFFTQEILDRRDRDLLHFLRQRWPRAIAMEVTENPGISFRQLRERLGILPSALSVQIRRLVNASIIVEAPEGRTKVYRCEEPQRVRTLIVRYRPTFLDAVVDKFAETWGRL